MDAVGKEIQIIVRRDWDLLYCGRISIIGLTWVQTAKLARSLDQANAWLFVPEI